MSEKRVGPRIIGVVKSQLKNGAHLRGQWWEDMGEDLGYANEASHIYDQYMAAVVTGTFIMTAKEQSQGKEGSRTSYL